MMILVDNEVPSGSEDDGNDDAALVKPLPWASRLSAMPYLPGGGTNQIASLRELLHAVVSHDGLLTAIVADANGLERSLRDALKPLSSAGFVQSVDRSHMTITNDALEWLHSDDDAQLLAIFHRHIRYVGELLAALDDGPVSVRDLMQVAAESFDLNWTTPDQTRRRVTWLSCMGAVEYRTATLIHLTTRGRAMLKRLILDGPTASVPPTIGPVVLKSLPPTLARLVDELTPASLSARNQTLGYVPRGNGEADIVQALEALVNAASPNTSKADLLAFAGTHFGVSESSFGAVLTTLTKSGLIEQTALNVYEPTKSAREWLETVDPLDLAMLVHARYLFVLEIIPMLREYDRAPDLARAAVDYYGMKRVDVSGVRNRLQILQAAGLIVERANWRYQSTALGDEVALRYPIQAARQDDPDDVQVSHQDAEGQPLSLAQVAQQLGRELINAGIDSDNPVRLEQSAAAALQFLGFEARHVGGGGKTDVLATVDDENLKSIRIIFDAKSARSGTVNEGAVSFDTLREHRSQHKADHVVLVGPGFDAGRVRARADQNHVTLVTSHELAEILARHARTPLSAFHYLGVFTGNAEDRRRLESYWSSAARRKDLLAQVITVLAEEARDTDEVTHGALTSDQIYLIAREGGTGPRPQPRDIESVLELLQHPLIDSVRAVPGDRSRPPAYHLIDGPTLVQDKLAALAQALRGLGEAITSD